MSIMPGIENLAPERTETSSGSRGSPSLRPIAFSRSNTCWEISSSRPSGHPFVHVRAARVGRDRESRRDGQLEDRCHLGEVCTLAAEQVLVLHRRAAVLVVEAVDVRHTDLQHRTPVNDRRPGPEAFFSVLAWEHVPPARLRREGPVGLHHVHGVDRVPLPRRVRLLARRVDRRADPRSRARTCGRRSPDRRAGRDLTRLPGRLRVVPADPGAQPSRTGLDLVRRSVRPHRYQRRRPARDGREPVRAVVRVRHHPQPPRSGGPARRSVR